MFWWFAHRFRSTLVSVASNQTMREARSAGDHLDHRIEHDGEG